MAEDKKANIPEEEIRDIAEGIEDTVEEAAEQAAEEITEAAEDVEETAEEDDDAAEAAEEIADGAGEESEEDAAEEAADEVAEAEESDEDTAEEAAEPPVKISSKRLKKIERREAKAARKAANKIEEKRSRPNNALIAILIFGVVVGMFAFVLCYNYFSKPATIESYIEKNGGEETYGSMALDAYTTANITAKGNSMNIEMTINAEDEAISEQIAELYSGDEGKKQIEYIAAYFLTTVKPQTRAFSADVKASIKMGDKELNSAELTYKEAKKVMEPDEEESTEDAEEAEETTEGAEEGADDAAGDAVEVTEDDAADAEENE